MINDDNFYKLVELVLSKIEDRSGGGGRFGKVAINIADVMMAGLMVAMAIYIYVKYAEVAREIESCLKESPNSNDNNYVIKILKDVFQYGSGTDENNLFTKILQKKLIKLSSRTQSNFHEMCGDNSNKTFNVDESENEYLQHLESGFNSLASIIVKTFDTVKGTTLACAQKAFLNAVDIETTKAYNFASNVKSAVVTLSLTVTYFSARLGYNGLSRKSPKSTSTPIAETPSPLSAAQKESNLPVTVAASYESLHRSQIQKLIINYNLGKANLKTVDMIDTLKKNNVPPTPVVSSPPSSTKGAPSFLLTQNILKPKSPTVQSAKVTPSAMRTNGQELKFN